MEDALEPGTHVQMIRRWLPERRTRPERMGASLKSNPEVLPPVVPADVSESTPAESQRPLSGPSASSSGLGRYVESTGPFDLVSMLLTIIMVLDLCLLVAFFFSSFGSRLAGIADSIRSIPGDLIWVLSALGLAFFLALCGWIARSFIKAKDS